MMKNRLLLGGLIVAAVLCVRPLWVTADDNEIFGISGVAVEPNVLIIFDNSGSMREEAVSDCREECVSMECVAWGECREWVEQCYRRCVRRNRWGICTRWVEECYDECASRICEEWQCNSWEEVCEPKTRMQVAQETIKQIIDDYGDDHRLGIMVFHFQDGGFFPEYENLYPVCSVKESFIHDSAGNRKTGEAYQAALDEYKEYLKSFVDTLTPSTWTPLAETLAEAGLYFANAGSWFNAGDSTYPLSGKYPGDDVKAYSPDAEYPPIGIRCRNNYIILMTDGEPTRDDNEKLKGVYIDGKTIAGGQLPTLDQVAGFLYENDINPYFDTPDYTQNITTYAIGFQGGDPELLQKTADRGTGAPAGSGAGLYFDATDQEELTQAFITIMANINERQTSFVAPVVPVSSSSRAYAGDSVYMALFQPTGESRWIGNLKKYSLNDNNEISSCGTQTPIMDANGRIKDSARSCWSTHNDGNIIDAGGAGGVLAGMADYERNIYSNISENPDLTAAANAFTTDNDQLTGADFGVSDKDMLINEIRGKDKRWKMGDLNHSRPAVAIYGTGSNARSYVFAGTNGGLLHCFDDDYGREKWAFVPQEQFSRLKYVYTGGHDYFMDGSPTVADTADGKKILIFGERRGGNRYYALDITDIDAPEYLYTHTTGGQSWKTPQFTRIVLADGTIREVFLLTGGYDARLDNDAVAEKGRSVYTIDALTGEVVGFFMGSDDFPDMSSLVSAVALDPIDDGKSIAAQIYAADLGGRVYAARDHDDLLDSCSLNGDWHKLELFNVTAGGKKIFEEVDVVPEILSYFDIEEGRWENVIGDHVFFGTGDRANPLRIDQVNHFYSIKNDWRTGPMTENSRVGDFVTLDDEDMKNEAEPIILDLSDNLIQDGTFEEQAAVSEALNARHNRGWYITLEDYGEKCLSAPVVYSGVVYFTTYTPPVFDDGFDQADPCRLAFGNTGISRLYALDYKTGAAVYSHFSDDGELDKEARSKIITDHRVSIAPSPKIFVTEEGEVLFVGPHQETPLSELGGVRLFYWKSGE